MQPDQTRPDHLVAYRQDLYKVVTALHPSIRIPSLREYMRGMYKGKKEEKVRVMHPRRKFRKCLLV